MLDFILGKYFVIMYKLDDIAKDTNNFVWSVML